MKVAVLGRTHWLLGAARSIHRAGYSLVLVATAKAQPEYAAREDDFSSLAREVSAPFYLDPDVNSDSFRQAVASSRAEIAVSVNWPTLIREQTCSAFRLGILNGHAGDLPRYRGNACPNWAILNNESRVGLCVHTMDPSAIDAGPVYARRHFALDEGTYIADVYRWIEGALPEIFVEALRKAADSSFVPEDQSATGVQPLRCHPRRPDDALIDWRLPAEQICRLVRASSQPFTGAFSYLDGGVRVTIWRARRAIRSESFIAVPGQIMGLSADGGLLVACGSGAIEVQEAARADGMNLPQTNRYRLHSHRM